MSLKKIGSALAIVGCVVVFQNCSGFNVSTPLNSVADTSPPSSIYAIPASLDASQLDMQGKNQCGTAYTRISIAGMSHEVFTGPIEDGSVRETWHQWIPCLDNLLNLAQTSPSSAGYFEFIYNQIYFILSRPNARFQSSVTRAQVNLAGITDDLGRVDLSTYDLPVYINNFQLPYDSMSATDLGYFLLQAHAALKESGYPTTSDQGAYETNFYLQLALGSNALVLTDVSSGGLRSRKVCDVRTDLMCSFFFSSTTEDNEDTTAGATINKELFAVRDLYSSAQILDSLVNLPDTTYSPAQIANLKSQSAAYKNGSLEGANQMVYSASALPIPNLNDYIAKDSSGNGVIDSWLYYTYDTDALKGDFIHNRRYKNCAYHLQTMELLASIIPALGSTLDQSGFTLKHPELDNSSVLGFLLKTYNLKIKQGFTNQPPNLPGTNFDACDPTHTHPLDKSVLAFFKNYP